ncbi:MAG: hypothetical protein ACT4P0_08800 [Panacagrimonas sp.]
MMRAVLLVTCVALNACAANSYCLAKQNYQNAETARELRPVDGLTIPGSPSALRLPKPPANPQPFGQKDENGDGVCLDKPPRMKPVATAPDAGASS